MSALPKIVLSAGGLALLVACSEPTTPPVAPELVLAAASPTSAVAQVGSLMIDYPAVIVRDASGNPVPDVSVTFRVNGGGFLAGSVSRTNAAGVAKPLTWMLSTEPRLNTVVASIDSHTEVAFEVQGITGPVAQLIKITGDQQLAPRETVLPIRPAVRVTDRFGNPVTGAHVTFSVATGGGSITGAEVDTDIIGVARLGGWTIGRAGGQSVKATVDSVSVFFTANIRLESLPCLNTGTIATVLTSELDAHSTCASENGRYYEAWNVDLNGATGWEFKLESAQFDPLLELRDQDGLLLAINDNENSLVTSARFRVLLPPGRYVPVVTSGRPDGLGLYRLSHSPAGTGAGCGDTFVTRGIALMQQMIAKQCIPGTDSYDDEYRIHLQAHSILRVTIDDWSYSDPLLEILDADRKVLMTGTQEGFYVDKAVFEAPADGFYTIRVTSRYDELIRYTLTVN